MKPVELLSYEYPDTIRLLINGKVYTYVTSEYWARKAINQLRYGDGWRGVSILKKNGEMINETNSL